MAAIDPVRPPHYDEATERKTRQPAEIMLTDPPIRLRGPAKGNIRTMNDQILGAARDRYKKLVLRNMYPMGYDFVTALPTKADGTHMTPQADPGVGLAPHHESSGAGCSGRGGKPLHLLKQQLWKKAVRHGVAKVEGKGTFNKKMLALPERPRMRQIFAAQQRAARGISARGLELDEYANGMWEPEAYTTSGNGTLHITHEGAGMASGSGTSGGFIQALLPLITMAGPLITEGINMISGIISNAIARRKAKKEAEARAAAEEAAAREAGVTPLTTGHGVAPPPAVGLANPFTRAINTLHWRFPIPPPKWPIHPDPLSLFREIYNRARGVLGHTAKASGIAEHKATPAINKMLWRHAKSTFGHGFANEILHTQHKLKPMPEVNAWNIIAPFLRGEKLQPVAHHILSTPHRGGSLGDILGALGGVFSNLGPEIVGSAKSGLSALATAASEYAPMWKEGGKAGAKAIIAAVKSPNMRKFLAATVPGGVIGILSAIMKVIRNKAAKNRLTVPPEAEAYLNLPEPPPYTTTIDPSEDYEARVRRQIIERRSKGKGMKTLHRRVKKLYKSAKHQRLSPSDLYGLLHLTAGHGVWDLLSTVGNYGLEFAAPMLGSMASKALGAYDPAFEELGMRTTRGISKALARQREREAEEDFSQRRRRQALDDLERASKASPEQLADLRKKAEAAKTLSEIITSLEGDRKSRSIYSPDLILGDVHHRPVPAHFGRSSRYDTDESSDEEFWKSYRRSHKPKVETSSSESEEKPKKHKKKKKKHPEPIESPESAVAEAPQPPAKAVSITVPLPQRSDPRPMSRNMAEYNSVNPEIERFRARAVAAMSKKRTGQT
jgi:hypothetical protein